MKDKIARYLLDDLADAIGLRINKEADGNFYVLPNVNGGTHFTKLRDQANRNFRDSDTNFNELYRKIERLDRRIQKIEDDHTPVCNHCGQKIANP